MLRSARIMSRADDEVNGSRTRRASIAGIFFFVAALALVACGGAERRAERLWRQALDRVAAGDTSAAVVAFQKIIDEYDELQARIADYTDILASEPRQRTIVSEELAEITAKYADHWNFVGGPPEEFARKRDVLAAHCADIGRDPKEITLSAHVRLGADLERNRNSMLAVVMRAEK